MMQKVIIVSGGSRGLGASIAQELLEKGHIVCTFSRSESEFTQRHKDNPNFFWSELDIQDDQALKDFVNQVYKRYGSIYGLVNNAGIGTEGVYSTMKDALIAKTLDINLTRPILLTKQVAKKMLCANSGCIINISSVNSVRGHSGVAAYSAAKAGLDGFTRSLAKELGPKGIRVNSICPGYFESDMVNHMRPEALNRIQRRTPLGRLGKTSDMSNVVSFLLDRGDFITGQTIVVDGGLTC